MINLPTADAFLGICAVCFIVYNSDPYIPLLDFLFLELAVIFRKSQIKSVAKLASGNNVWGVYC